MNRTGYKRLLAMICSFVIVLSSTQMGGARAAEESSAELAPLYGKFDLFSSASSTVLVELEEPSILEGKQKGLDQTEENLEYHRMKVIEQLNEKMDISQVQAEYDYVFSGFSLQLPGNRIPDLLTIPGVKAVYADVEYTTAAVGHPSSEEEDQEFIRKKEMRNEMTDSAPYIGAEEVWTELGLTGEGIRVAVLDTGVQYDHPDLQGSFGEYKGWDAIEDDEDPRETQAGDPGGEETYHGTHVAGTIAGDGTIKGIAPNATLLAYRVLGPGGTGKTTHVLEGIERAAEDEVDIMNLSIEHDPEHFDWATHRALDLVMNAGIVVVTSNGNEGPTNWTAGSPGTSSQAISVGASQLPYQIYETHVYTSGEYEYNSAEVMGFTEEENLLDLNGKRHEFVPVGLGTEQDYKEKDVQGKIALIRRGDIPFTEKVHYAQEAGAIGAIIYNHIQGSMDFNLPGLAIPTLQLNKKDGLQLLAQHNEGKDAVRLKLELLHEVDETMASFSSRGPVSDIWEIKPDVVAPGMNITSTVPNHDPEERPYDYASLRGTSVAAPHVTGATALLLEAQPEWSVDAVKSALMNTAEKMTNTRGNAYAYNTQGAGSIRVAEAIQTETLVIPGSHSFGSFTKENGKQSEQQELMIQNLADEKKRYSFEVEFHGDPEGIQADIDEDVVIGPQASEEVQLNVQVDPGGLETGYYESTIRVYGSVLDEDSVDGKTDVKPHDPLHDKAELEVEVPAILFINETEDLDVTEFSLEQSDSESYEFDVRLPRGGVDHLQFWIYSADPLTYVTDAGSYTSVSEEESSFTWEGMTNGAPLSPGTYDIYAYVEKDGQGEIVHGATFEVD